MNSVTSMIVLLGVIGLACPNAMASDYCSLIVRVLNLRGTQVYATVQVQEKSGRTIRSEQTPLVAARFCDLGLEPVTVKTGGGGCNLVEVKEVQLEWQQEIQLVITQNTESCYFHHYGDRSCEFVFRIAAPSGEWLSGAFVKTENAPEPKLTDHAGRALVRISRGASARGTITMMGYRPTTFAEHCSDSGMVHLDRKIVLEIAK